VSVREGHHVERNQRHLPTVPRGAFIPMRLELSARFGLDSNHGAPTTLDVGSRSELFGNAGSH
jgi:hypothetical protein